jgi:hypothetical protein
MADVGKYTPGGVKTFSCPNCGGTVGIRAVGVSVSAACQSCGSVIDVANDELRLINKALEHTKKDLLLPLGARGELLGVEWEVIGYMERGDEANTYSWSEYLLFNPWQGFRFLVESAGSWSFVKMLRREITDATYEGKTYKLFFRDEVMVKYVLGEFYWRAATGERTLVSDYIAPPYVLSSEWSDEDVLWSRGVYTDPETIQEAFGIDAEWPPPSDIAANEPGPLGQYGANAIAVLVVALACLIGLQVLAVSGANNQVLIDRMVQATSPQAETPVTTEAFDIPDRTGNLEIRVSSPVDNDWLELDAELVNQDTQEQYEAIETVEYYHGYDSDGAWSEGGQVSSDILSAIPGGKYRLFLTADAGSFESHRPTQYRLIVARDVPVWSNFWTAFLLLGAALGALVALERHFESQRWANSYIAGFGAARSERRDDRDEDA